MKANVVKINKAQRSSNAELMTRDKTVFWDGDYLVFIHYGNISYDDVISNFRDGIALEFKSLVIDWINLNQYSSSSYFRFFTQFRKLSSTAKNGFNLTWLSSITQDNCFAQIKSALAKLLLFFSQKSDALVHDNIELLIKKIQVRQKQSSNVLSDDPTVSRLTHFEFDALIKNIWNDFEHNETGHQTTLIRLLSAHYFRRPAQIAHLKIGDIYFDNLKDISNTCGPRIFFPGVKDLYSDGSFRASKFEYRPLADHLIGLIQLQIQEIRKLFQDTLKIQIDDALLKKLPLFCTVKTIKKAVVNLSEHFKYDLIVHLDSQLFHLSEIDVGNVIRFNQNCHINKRKNKSSNLPISHRTNDELVVTATRMRHTNAFFLARKGVSRADLTNILGHSSGRSVDAYYRDPAEDARKLNEAIGTQMTHWAMAFSGKLINRHEQRRLVASGAETILQHDDKQHHLHSVGNCGKHSFCGSQTIPIPCYRCNHFQPFVEANHEEVLQALIARQKQENDTIQIGSSRNLLNPIDLSLDIECVKTVIAQCDEYKKSEKLKVTE